MEPNFYEKIVSEKDDNKKNLVKKMSELLDDSLESFISIRQRQSKETKNINFLFGNIIRLHSMNLDNDERENNVRRGIYRLNHHERLQRIRNMEEETDNLERLINENFEVVG